MDCDQLTGSNTLAKNVHVLSVSYIIITNIGNWYKNQMENEI